MNSDTKAKFALLVLFYLFATWVIAAYLFDDNYVKATITWLIFQVFTWGWWQPKPAKEKVQ